MECVTVQQIDSLDLPVSGNRWSWADDNRTAIDRFWNRALAEKPAMFNGDILMLGDYTQRDAALTGQVLQSNFASLLYWKDQGMPHAAGARNVFGCAVVRSSEGHLLFGRMAQHTAMSGRVYPMAGTPDANDIRDGRLDIEGSIIRELKEESGLDAADATRVPGYLCLEDGGMVALAAVFDFNVQSRELRVSMQRHLDTSAESELDEIVVFRRAGFHIHHRMPAFARKLVQHLLD